MFSIISKTHFDNDLDVQDIDFNKYKVIGIRAPMGSGKTELIKKFIESNSQFSFITFTARAKSLCEGISYRIPILNCYTKIKSFENADLPDISKLSICINSFYKFWDRWKTNIIKSKYLIVIDEWEQLIATISNISEIPKTEIRNSFIFTFFEAIRKLTKKKNASIPFNSSSAFFKFLSHPNSKILISDAHLDYQDLTRVLTEFGIQSNEILILDYNIPSKKIAYHYFDAFNMFNYQVINPLINNEAVYITSDNRKFIQSVVIKLKQFFPHIRELMIIADDNGVIQNSNPAITAFFKDPNSESLKYDIVISSPSITTGISITNNHFKRVCGFFSVHIVDKNTLLQMLNRVRTIDNHYVHFDCYYGTEDNPVSEKQLNPLPKVEVTDFISSANNILNEYLKLPESVNNPGLFQGVNYYRSEVANSANRYINLYNIFKDNVAEYCRSPFKYSEKYFVSSGSYKEFKYIDILTPFSSQILTVDNDGRRSIAPWLDVNINIVDILDDDSIYNNLYTNLHPKFKSYFTQNDIKFKSFIDKFDKYLFSIIYQYRQIYGNFGQYLTHDIRYDNLRNFGSNTVNIQLEVDKFITICQKLDWKLNQFLRFDYDYSRRFADVLSYFGIIINNNNLKKDSSGFVQFLNIINSAFLKVGQTEIEYSDELKAWLRHHSNLESPNYYNAPEDIKAEICSWAAIDIDIDQDIVDFVCFFQDPLISDKNQSNFIISLLFKFYDINYISIENRIKNQLLVITEIFEHHSKGYTILKNALKRIVDKKPIAGKDSSIIEYEFKSVKSGNTNYQSSEEWYNNNYVDIPKVITSNINIVRQNKVWDGECIEIIEILHELQQFEYEKLICEKISFLEDIEVIKQVDPKGRSSKIWLLNAIKDCDEMIYAGRFKDKYEEILNNIIRNLVIDNISSNPVELTKLIKSTSYTLAGNYLKTLFESI